MAHTQHHHCTDRHLKGTATSILRWLYLQTSCQSAKQSYKQPQTVKASYKESIGAGICLYYTIPFSQTLQIHTTEMFEQSSRGCLSQSRVCSHPTAGSTASQQPIGLGPIGCSSS